MSWAKENEGRGGVGEGGAGGSEDGATVMGREGRGEEVLLTIHHAGTPMIVK